MMGKAVPMPECSYASKRYVHGQGLVPLFPVLPATAAVVLWLLIWIHSGQGPLLALGVLPAALGQRRTQPLSPTAALLPPQDSSREIVEIKPFWPHHSHTSAKPPGAQTPRKEVKGQESPKSSSSYVPWICCITHTQTGAGHGH